MTNDTAKTEGVTSPTKRKLSKGEKRLLLVSSAAMLLLASSVWLRALDSDPVIAPAPAAQAVPRSNAFEWFNKAGGALVKTRMLGDVLSTGRPGVRKINRSTVRVLSLSEKEALWRQNAPALSLLRRGLALRHQEPPALTDRARTKYDAACRNLARLLILDGQIRAARGDHVGAVNSYLDAAQLGITLPRGRGSYAFSSWHRLRELGASLVVADPEKAERTPVAPRAATLAIS